jgi:hypothetical protein
VRLNCKSIQPLFNFKTALIARQYCLSFKNEAPEPLRLLITSHHNISQEATTAALILPIFNHISFYINILFIFIKRGQIRQNADNFTF